MRTFAVIGVGGYIAPRHLKAIRDTGTGADGATETPSPPRGGRVGYPTHDLRPITMDGEEIEFTEGFTDLHTRVYQQALAGRGLGLADARPSIEPVHRIRTTTLAGDGPRHPVVAQLARSA